MDGNLVLVNPVSSHQEILFIKHETKSFVETEKLELLLLLISESLGHKEVCNFFIELLNVLWWEEDRLG